MIVAAVAVALVVALVAAAWYLRFTDRLLHDRRLQKVVVELRSGETFEGVLLACDARSVVLGSVSAVHGPETSPTKIDGTLLVPRGDLKFVQRP